MWERNVPRVLEGRFPSDAPIRLVAKDQTLIDGLARNLDLSLPLFQAARQFWSTAADHGLAEQDVAAAVRLLQD